MVAVLTAGLPYKLWLILGALIGVLAGWWVENSHRVAIKAQLIPSAEEEETCL